jgi:hypothetical protein
MATTVITGRDITLSFSGGTDVEAQATSAVLTKVFDRQVYQTLDGEAYKVTNVTAEFALEMLADWGKTNSVCEAIWTACDNAPNSVIQITMASAVGASFVFNIFPSYPTVGGSGMDAQTVSFTFTVENGVVTETFS